MKKMLLRTQKGFTLLEIMIVISLLAVLGTFVVGKLMDSLDEGNVKSAKIQINSIKGLLEEYRRFCNQYPTSDQGLEALLTKPTTGPECPNYPANGILDNNKMPADPWGHPYIFESDGKTYLISCLGRDGKEGGTGADADFNSKE